VICRPGRALVFGNLAQMATARHGGMWRCQCGVGPGIDSSLNQASSESGQPSRAPPMTTQAEVTRQRSTASEERAKWTGWINSDKIDVGADHVVCC